jgi:hypothetical protein
MNKKKIYMIIFAVVIILGYLNYFKEEKDLSDLKKAIETTNVLMKVKIIMLKLLSR